MNIKVLSIFGTRPEAIKMAPVVKELESRPNIKSVVCVTAQHRGMLDQVLDIFNIKPDYDLNIMKPGQTLTYITTEALRKIEEIIKKEKPNLVLVHGDTTTAMAGTLAAFYQHIKVGHVEAGLRTYDIESPFPEEVNRQIIDNISSLLFAPTKNSEANLIKQFNKNQKVFVTGNTAIDALKTTIKANYSHPVLDWVGNNRMILITAHRRENLGEPMSRIFTAVRKITDNFNDVRIVYPIHLNPAVRQTAQKILSNNDKVKLIEPLDVLDFHNFMEAAYFIMSDSGGVQEEAPSLGKPVLVLRETTERPEGVEAGTLRLVGTDTENIYNEAERLLTDFSAYKDMSTTCNPYGDGFASKYIVDEIIKYFDNKTRSKTN